MEQLLSQSDAAVTAAADVKQGNNEQQIALGETLDGVNGMLDDISHRLSSCKFCDKIAVFSEGHIAEYGTHDELISIPSGIYAEMFEAQAKYYVEESAFFLST